ncbi:uncharacterized protein LOC135687230 isoform X2 [Rhopilema esculentum]
MGHRALLSLALLVTSVATESGFVSEFFEGKRCLCSNEEMKVYTVSSEIQCIHRCLRHDECEAANYNKQSTKKNCEVSLNGTCSSFVEVHGWKSLVIKRQDRLEKKVYHSCKEAYFDIKDAPSGVYRLHIGRHFCKMDIPGCGGGWTLAMKINGSKGTFGFNSPMWSNDQEYNTENGLKSLYEHEAKFAAFSHLAFDEICIGMKNKDEVNWLRLPLKYSSLLAILTAGQHILTHVGRSAWKGLISSSSLQPNCNLEGVNVGTYYNKPMVRIGIIANDQNDCSSPDSYIALGGRDLACGNSATACVEGNQKVPTMGFILVK